MQNVGGGGGIFRESQEIWQPTDDWVRLNTRDSVKAANVGNRPQIKRFIARRSGRAARSETCPRSSRPEGFAHKEIHAHVFRQERIHRLGNNRNTRINMQIRTRIFHASLLHSFRRLPVLFPSWKNIREYFPSFRHLFTLVNVANNVCRPTRQCGIVNNFDWCNFVQKKCTLGLILRSVDLLFRQSWVYFFRRLCTYHVARMLSSRKL